MRLSRSVPSGPKYDKIKRVLLPSVDNASFPGIGDDCVMKGWGCKSGGKHFGILPIFNLYFQIQVASKMARWHFHIHMYNVLWVFVVDDHFGTTNLKTTYYYSNSFCHRCQAVLRCSQCFTSGLWQKIMCANIWNFRYRQKNMCWISLQRQGHLQGYYSF